MVPRLWLEPAESDRLADRGTVSQVSSSDLTLV
jgi:hypothetical protein